MREGSGSALAELVTIVVAPREKHSTLTASLASLFQTVPNQVRVLACLPKLPLAIREEASALIARRGNTELREFEADLIPHRARALGAKQVETPWIVFVDNDLQYEPGWLEALAAAMRNEAANVLAPLIFIGPPAASVIHHAGGMMTIQKRPGGGIEASEQHRLMNVDVNEPGVADALISDDFRHCDVAEFHCLALRSTLLENDLQLPEVLITREQQDLALQLKQLGMGVNFVPEARVTYMARTEFTVDDLQYHALRWSEARAKESLDYMETTWGMEFERNRVLYKWIEKHRRRPFLQRCPALVGFLPRSLVGSYLLRRYGYPV